MRLWIEMRNALNEDSCCTSTLECRFSVASYLEVLVTLSYSAHIFHSKINLRCFYVVPYPGHEYERDEITVGSFKRTSYPVQLMGGG